MEKLTVFRTGIPNIFECYMRGYETFSLFLIYGSITKGVIKHLRICPVGDMKQTFVSLEGTRKIFVYPIFFVFQQNLL